MALGHYDIPISRDQVYGWLKDWQKKPKKDRPSREQYILDRLQEAGHEDTELNVSGRDDIGGDSTPLWSVILDDLDSYGITK